MLVIGIAGGIASGKSLVTRQFQKLGAAVLDADHAGHEVLRDPAVVEMLTGRWGDAILADGQIDRASVAKIVFDEGDRGKADLAFLEEISHPRIREKLQGELSRLKAEEKAPAVVFDAPVMFKAGWDSLCDKIVFIDATIDVRVERAKASRNWTRTELLAREARQTSLTTKKLKSTDQIDNSGSVEDCVCQIESLWKNWGLKFPDGFEKQTNQTRCKT